MKKIILLSVGICLVLLLTQFIVSENDSSVFNMSNSDDILENGSIINDTLIIDNTSNEIIINEENIISEEKSVDNTKNTISYDKQRTELTNQLNGDIQESKFYISTDSITGKVRFIGSDLSNAIVHPSSFDINSATSEDSARQFLSDYGSYLGIKNENSELSLIYSKNLNDGRSVVRMQQEYDGVPVFGGEMIVQMNSEKSIISVGSKIMPDLNVDTGYTIDADEASEKSLNAVAKYYKVDASSLQTTIPELWIYDPRVFGDNNVFIKNPVLVWRMDVFNGDLDTPINELTLVDAKSGKIALHFTQIYTAKYRKIYDSGNVRNNSLPGSNLIRVEGGAASGISDANYAYNYSGDTYDFYYNYFDRDSIDDLGMNLTSTVRFCYTTGACPYANAFWNGEQMTYGNGYSSADDVVAHEMSHGVTENESNLFYYMQSGAINEAFSDIMGEFVDLTNNAGDDSDEVRWLMGEDLSIGAIRSASDPTLYGDPDSMNSTNYYCGTGDNGGVHYNSGVANKAAYLITDGDTFNGYTITGIGINKTAQLFYEANTNLLTSGSDYSDLYDALIQAAINLNFSSSEKLTVEKAVNATQMGKEIVCTMIEAPVCDIGAAHNLFFDDLENITSGYWTTVLSSGTYGFYYPQNPNGYDTDSTYATSGRYNIWGDDPSSATESYIKMNLNVSLQSGTEPYLYFKHAYGFEDEDTCYDGGVIEYSLNGGATWVDGGSLIINNNYTGTIFDGLGNPLADRPAFCGTSYGYTSSKLNLSSLAGQNISFRFRIGADAFTGDYGWFIDDVRIYTCLETTAPVVHLISPRNNTFRNFENTSHLFNVTDDSGPANCTFFWNDFSLSNSNSQYPIPVDGSEQDAGNLTSSDGNVTWTINCTDSAGNTGAGEVWIYTVDTIYPTISFESDTTAAGNHNQNWIYVNVTANDTNFNSTIITLYNSTMGWIQRVEELASKNLAYNFTGLSDGTYYINATTSDLAGNVNNTATRNITLDTTSPRINLTYPRNTTYTSVIASINYTLTEINQQTCWFYNGTANNTITCGQNITANISSSQGSNTWIVYANDSTGNMNSSSITFFVDSINPTINFTSPTEISGLTNSTRNYLLVNVTANDTNLKNITIRLYNSSRTIINSTNSTTSPLYANFSNLADGTYYLNATACDNAGNCNNTETINITIDANPPIITINSPALNSYYKSAISFNVTLNKNGTCLYSIDGAINKSMSPSADNRNFNATNSSMSQAAHNVTFSCNDTYNTWNFTSRAFYFDTTAPVVTLISPEDGSTDYEEDEDINFKYNVTDAFGIANCSLLIDEEVISTDTTITNNDDEQTISYDGISSSETYEWTIKCYDYAGNSHEPSGWTIEIQAKSDDTPDGGSPGGGSDDPVIYKVSDTKLSQGYTKQMGVGDKLNFSVDSTSHILTLKSIKGKNATITIASTPQTITLKEGEEIKLDLASDNYYDIIVKLMNISGSTAKINIKSIYELKPPTLRSTTNSSSNLTTNSSLGNTEGNDGWTNESWMNKLVNSFKEFFLDTFSNKCVLIGAGVLVVGGIVCLVLYVRKKIRQKKGWDK